MNMMYRDLTKDEEQEFRVWARQNFKAGDHVNELWHPIVKDECRLIDAYDTASDRPDIADLDIAVDSMIVQLIELQDDISHVESLEIISSVPQRLLAEALKLLKDATDNLQEYADTIDGA
jgi:hypothetical protein